MVVGLIQKTENFEYEVDIIIPFLIEYKIWISKNPSTLVKISSCFKEYAKISRLHLKSNTSCWLAYSEFCQKLFDTNFIKKESKIAMEAFGLESDFLTCSSRPCSQMPVENVELKTDANPNILSYNASDRLGMLPYSYGMMLQFLADLIGVCPKLLERRVHRHEIDLNKSSP
jgi:hypothetical protein